MDADALRAHGHVGEAPLEYLEAVAAAEAVIAARDVVPTKDHRSVEGSRILGAHDDEPGLVRRRLDRLDLPPAVASECRTRCQCEAGRSALDEILVLAVVVLAEITRGAAKCPPVRPAGHGTDDHRLVGAVPLFLAGPRVVG